MTSPTAPPCSPLKKLTNLTDTHTEGIYYTGAGAMAPIRLENAQPGMELAADVTDRNGQLLAKAGKELSDKELRLFKMWGVIEVEIAGGDGDDGASPAMDAEILPEHEEAAKEYFRHADMEHELMGYLFRECTRRLAREGGPRA